MLRDPIPQLNIEKVYEYLGGDLPAHIRKHTWNPVRCLVHGGDSGSLHPALGKIWCFGCTEARGDGYDLLRLIEGIELTQAKELAEERGWVVDSGPTRGPARKPHNARRPDRTERGRKPRR